MAKYMEISNANNNVVIDDTYENCAFLWRGSATTIYENSGIYTYSNGQTAYGTLDTILGQHWYGPVSVAIAPSLRALGFDADDSQINIVQSNLQAFVRPTFGHSVIAYVSLTAHYDGGFQLSAGVISKFEGHTGEIALYYLGKMMPSSVGMIVYNESDNIVFDAVRGYLQNIDLLYGDIALGGDVARSYSIVLPAGVSPDDVFMSTRSQQPYRHGLKVYQGGSYAILYEYYYAQFASWDASTRVLLIELRRINNVGYNGSVYNFGVFFEQLIYCPFPKNKYLGVQ